ncbi:NAD(P)/FAD-dependent oxidoreductase (plasmid) [Rhizobium leguminosarum]
MSFDAKYAEAYDVAIVGGGCAGLMTADFLSELGARVAIVERSEKIAPGPSTRNGGYVHGGGFHAAVIDDPVRAAKTAERCRAGRDFFWTHHWSAIYHDAAPVRLLVRDKILAARSLQRWREIGIEADVLTSGQLSSADFDFVGDAAIAATVNDLPINYALVYQKILARFLQRRGAIFVGHEFLSYEDGLVTIRAGAEEIRLPAKQVVYCSGYDTNALVQRNRDRWPSLSDVSFKLWKSHVLQTRRFTRYGYMIVDPGEVSVMPQGDYCVVCQSQEDAEIQVPNYEKVGDRVSGIHAKLVATYRTPSDIRFESNACLKPSVHVNGQGSRSVDIHVFQLSPTEILALPGKATEAPLMAAEVVSRLQNMLTSSISNRPGEDHTW